MQQSLSFFLVLSLERSRCKLFKTAHVVVRDALLLLLFTFATEILDVLHHLLFVDLFLGIGMPKVGMRVEAQAADRTNGGRRCKSDLLFGAGSLDSGK